MNVIAVAALRGSKPPGIRVISGFSMEVGTAGVYVVRATNPGKCLLQDAMKVDSIVCPQAQRGHAQM